ncbi:MAG TPA: TMEM175 family protein, partial [Amaricoccus sp.]|nr:TMEM175 family protein [Amaricoccus sp.]
MSEAPRGSYRRENAGLEFDRVSFFTDAVYAIAMTLLVVDLHVPELAAAKADPAALAAAIWGERTAISA